LPACAERRRNRADCHAAIEHGQCAACLGSRRRLAAQVSPCGLGLGDSLALTLQHHFALELREAREDRLNEFAGRALGIDSLAAKIEDANTDRLGVERPFADLCL
jgi:hypothetical protein